MKIVKGLLPHKTPDGYIAVATGDAANRLNGMLRLNETGAHILRLLEKDITPEEIAQELVKTYDISLEVAKKDTESFLQVLEGAGLIIS